MRGAFDFETWKWTNPFFAGFMWGPKGARQFSYRHDKGPQTLESSRKLMAQSLLLCQRIRNADLVSEWWGHNAGKFDWLAFLETVALQHLPGWTCSGKVAGGSRVIELAIRPPGEKPIRFYDSMAVVNSSLKRAAKDFQLEHGKKLTDDDYRKDPRTWSFSTLFEGCQMDCLLVLELLDKVESFAEGWGAKLKNTFSQIALAAMKAHLADAGLELPNHEEAGLRQGNEFCRCGYYGGRVEVYHHCPPCLVDIYDVTSMYPAAMKRFMPWKPLGPIPSVRLMEKLLDSPGKLEGCLLAEVDVPDMPVPPLPYKAEDGAVMFPTGKWTATFAATELRYARSLGVKVRPIAGWAYTAKRPFVSFIDAVITRKVEAAAAGRTAEAEFDKLVANGGYGKLGQKPEVELLEVLADRGEAEALHLQNLERIQRGEGSSLSRLGDDPRFLLKHSTRWAKHTHFAMAAYVTAEARILFHQAALTHVEGDMLHLYYGDTDSQHITHGRAHPNPGSLIGQWKLKPEETALHAAYYGPKLYSHRKGLVERFKAKGFPLRHSCTEGCPDDCEFKGGYEPGAFLKVVQGQPLVVERMAMAKGQLRRGGEFQRVKDFRTWQGHSTKRRPLPDGSTVPWTVEELERGEQLDAVSPLYLPSGFAT